LALDFHFFCLDTKETKQRKSQDKTMLPPTGSHTPAVLSGQRAVHDSNEWSSLEFEGVYPCQQHGNYLEANGQGIDPDFPDQKLPLSISFGIKDGL
jgi:hypothetical protein